MLTACQSLPFDSSHLPESTRPNIVFILIDDLGWTDAGFMGSDYYETPNIDRLAAEGVVFTNAYANAPNCAPSRACLLTGQYTPRHGVYTVGSPARGPDHLRKLVPIPNRTTLQSGVVTLAEALQSAGYVSAAIGKWHLGEGSETGPRGQGFDLNIAGNQAGHPKTYFSPYRNPGLSDGPPGEYLTDRLTDEAIRFIEANQHQPFFLYLSHYAVHTPIQAKEDKRSRYAAKPTTPEHHNPKYAAMIESVDDGVGRIVETLDRLAISENTIVVFFSDNGGHAGVTSNRPLRGGKGMLYEGGIRVPLVIRWPAVVQGGRICDTPVIGTDFYPTFIQAAGIAPPPDVLLDGNSIMPHLRGQSTVDQHSLYWHFPAYLQSTGKAAGPWRTTPAGAIRQGDWKLIEFFEEGRTELYNLRTDIGEQVDLAEMMPEKTNELLEQLRTWRESINAPVPTDLNPEYNPGITDSTALSGPTSP